MNERIAKLANESGFDVDKTGAFGNYSEMHRLEKFADSIVWECMKICEDVMKKDNSALASWSEIKRKFRS